MKVLVLGAGGRTGGAVVRHAVASGHEVTALVRHPESFDAPAGVAVRTGDATNADDVTAAVAGQDAVIDTIAGTTPYKRNISLEADAAKAVIAAMQHHPGRRLLVTSSLGVGDSIANGTPFIRVLIRTFLRGSTADKGAMERAVEASGLDWTIARPAILNDDKATRDVRVFDAANRAKAHKISREDLAAWLVAQPEDGRYVGQAVTLATS